MTIKETIETALMSGVPLSDLLSGEEYRKALRELKRSPGGISTFKHLLRRGSQYDLSVASRLVCTPDKALDVACDGPVPLTTLANGNQELYQALYNRVLRKDASRVKQMTGGRRSLPTTPLSYFTFNDDLLEQLRTPRVSS